MLFPHVSFVLEVMGACLLLVMIIYAVQLNRRLSQLQADKAYLQKMVISFNQATERAEASINRLRTAALEANEALQVNTKVAKDLRTDLSFMIERAEGMADRLEGSIGASRTQEAAQSAQPAQPARSAEISAFRPANRGGAAVPAASPAKTALSRALAGLR